MCTAALMGCGGDVARSRRACLRHLMQAWFETLCAPEAAVRSSLLHWRAGT